MFVKDFFLYNTVKIPPPPKKKYKTIKAEKLLRFENITGGC